VAPVRGRKVVWVRWDADQYPYLARVEWNKHGGLTLSVQSRDQRELAVLRADPRTGQTAPLVSERDAAWVNLDQDVPRWVANGNSFLWTSEREGSKQLELRAADGQLLRVLAPPELGCQSLVSVDERGGLVYFCASPDPTQSHLHRVSLNGGEAVAMTRRPGLHGAVFARDFSVYVHSVSTPEATPVSAVRRLDGSVIGELPSVAEPPPFLPKFQLLKVGEGGGFYARVIRPSDFAAQRKYPVLMNVYGGPRANVVQAALSGQFLNQWLADRGFIVVSLDGRGTPGRGREWERAIFKGFGRVPLEDQVAGLAALGRQFPELDLEQVGVFGWSFGGYLSAQAVLRRPDVFKVAVAGAPVTDWLDYDTHYTERYLGFPEVHPEAYRESSLLTYAADLRRPLLLIHGTVDDNVYFRHSLKLADALFRAGRDFEMLPLAGFTHMVPDPVVTERLWSRIAAYFQQHLGAPSR
jgi:dipeptidyl-peptidase-4